MSGDPILDNEGYRAVGKHRFGAVMLTVLTATTGLGWLMAAWLGDARATAILRTGIAGIWIIRSSYSLYLGSDRKVIDADLETSPRLLRFADIIALIGFTILGTLAVQSLFVPE